MSASGRGPKRVSPGRRFRGGEPVCRCGGERVSSTKGPLLSSRPSPAFPGAPHARPRTAGRPVAADRAPARRQPRIDPGDRLDRLPLGPRHDHARGSAAVAERPAFEDNGAGRHAQGAPRPGPLDLRRSDGHRRDGRFPPRRGRPRRRLARAGAGGGTAGLVRRGVHPRTQDPSRRRADAGAVSAGRAPAALPPIPLPPPRAISCRGRWGLCLAP